MVGGKSDCSEFASTYSSPLLRTHAFSQAPTSGPSQMPFARGKSFSPTDFSSRRRKIGAALAFSSNGLALDRFRVNTFPRTSGSYRKRLAVDYASVMSRTRYKGIHDLELRALVLQSQVNTVKPKYTTDTL